MASGDKLFVLSPESYTPPSANFATKDLIPDASTPNMEIPVLDFDGVVSEHADWFVTIPSQYSGTTGFTFSFKYAMDGTDGDIIEIEFRVLPLADQTVLSADLGMDGQTPVAITDNPDATADDSNYTITGTLAKANFSSVGADERICIRATRDIAIAVNSDDLQLLEILIKET